MLWGFGRFVRDTWLCLWMCAVVATIRLNRAVIEVVQRWPHSRHRPFCLAGACRFDNIFAAEACSLNGRA